MGIKNLSKFLRTKFPEVYEDIHISEYHFKRVAIDTSLYLCSYKALYNDPNDPSNMSGWLSAFVKLVACLRENEVHCVFVYDSGYPPEKEAEKKDRYEQREKMVERMCKLEEAIDLYNTTGEATQYLIDFQKRRKIAQPSMLKEGQITINIKAIEYALEKTKKQLFNITPADYEASRKLFDILDVPYLYAPMEAETLCADLCLQGQVDAVLSEDTDVLTYGAPVFLTKFDPRSGTCKRIIHTDMLEKMDLSKDQFIDFCIMCGTDYNKNIFRVGPNKAYDYIHEHKTIEEVDKNTKLDISILNHVRVRELFKDYEKSTVKVSYCGEPDFSLLQQFLVKKNVRINVDILYKSFVRDNNLIIIDDSN